MALVAPLKADKAAWEATFTEEEKEAGNAFVEHLRANRESQQAFMKGLVANFFESDIDGDGLLNRDEFKQFVQMMD